MEQFVFIQHYDSNTNSELTNTILISNVYSFSRTFAMDESLLL